MRDPLSWSFPLGRLFGINLRVHILFPVFAVVFILRAGTHKNLNDVDKAWLVAAAVVGLLFVSVLLHELGHCFAARSVDGDAQDILMWPLGGLAYCEVPHTPKATFITAAGGPLVNVILCMGTAAILAAYSYVPPLNPWWDVYRPTLRDMSSGTDVHPPPSQKSAAAAHAPAEQPTAAGVVQLKPAETPARVLGSWEVTLARLFWVNWFMLLLNLLPGYPLDGGQMLQSVLWWRMDYRQAMLTAIFAGFVVMLVIGIYGMVIDEVMPLMLAMFIYFTCRQRWFILETGGEENLFGYDFSQGYTSLERDQPAPQPRRKRQNFIQRWLQRRAARKLQRENETREADERRMDELLEKVHLHGKAALTDEERRFLTRVSARYRNRH